MIKIKRLVSYISTLILLLSICINYKLILHRQPRQSNSDIFNEVTSTPSKSHSFLDILYDQIQYMKYDISKESADTVNFNGFINTDIIPPSSVIPTYDFKNISEKSFIQNRQPIVFRTPEVSKWKALQWDIWKLAYQWPLLHDVLELKVHPSHRQYQQQQQQQRVAEEQHQNSNNDSDNRLNQKSSPFYFPLFILENHPLHGSSGGVIDDDVSTTSRPQLVEQMLFLDFLVHERMSVHTPINESISKYFYSTNYALMARIANLTGDVDYHSLIYDEGFSTTQSNITAHSVPPNLLLLSSNCALQTRYSPYHTMKTQLMGRTKYILFSPDHARNLYLYPSIHASDKQSQVSLYQFGSDTSHGDIANDCYSDSTNSNHADVTTVTNNTDDTNTEANSNTNNQHHSSSRYHNKYPRIKNLHGYSTHYLNPGDTLYIPPYWSVLTENSNYGNNSGSRFSMVLETVSPSREQVILLEAYAMSLPFRRSNNLPADAVDVDDNKAKEKKVDSNKSDNNNTAGNNKESVDQTTRSTATVTTKWLNNMNNLTFPERVILSQIYLVHVLSRVDGLSSSISKYIRTLYKARYAVDLYPQEGLVMRRNKRKLSERQQLQQNQREQQQHSKNSDTNSSSSSSAGKEAAADDDDDDYDYNNIDKHGFDCFKSQRALAQEIADSLDKEYLIKGARFIADHVNNPALLISNNIKSNSTRGTVDASMSSNNINITYTMSNAISNRNNNTNTHTNTNTSTNRSGIKWIWLSDYIEQIARWAMMQNPNHAVLFLTQCFDEDTIVQKMDISSYDDNMTPGPSVLKIGSKHYNTVKELKEMIRRQHQ